MTVSGPLLKTQPIAEALGVSVSTVKRWVDSGVLRGARTVGKHRLVAWDEAVRFARVQGLPLDKLHALRFEEPRPRIDDTLSSALYEALCQGECARASMLIAAAYACGSAAAEFADDLIRPVMTRIGHGWEVGNLDIYQEHQATQVVLESLAAINSRLARSVMPDAPLALGATPEGDFYHLALATGELVLREVGWQVRNLGPNLPAASLAGAIASYRPRLVMLSVSYLADAESFVRGFAQVRDAASEVNAAIMIGGRALAPEQRGRLTYAAFGDRMADLAAFARCLGGTPVRPTI